MFSSPIGESTFSTSKEGHGRNDMGAVFVPYRGIYFLYEYLDGYITEEELVFVPYRGIYFLYQQKKIFENIIEECFRPLSGNLLSLRYYYSDAKVKDVDGFSSPIGESTFSTLRN